MKILVLQLARLGDIYMSWPALRALKRTHPDSEIHFLTRTKFEGAVQGLTVIDRHWQWPTIQMLEPLIQLSADLDEATNRVGECLKPMKAEQYDWIINLTFSPVSSFITHALSHKHTRVTGYTRHQDGYLAIPDEVSAYFYAQAGIGARNRVHLTDVFVSMMGLEYADADWAGPKFDARDFGLPERYVVVHVGASEAKKALPPFKWARVLKKFFDLNLEIPVVLIGAPSERNLGEAIESGVSRGRVINLIGHTQLTDLFTILQGADLLVGCDSAPMHMAGLTNTACLNISFDSVNFWETGPKAVRSYVHKVAFPEDLVSEEFAGYMNQILAGESPQELIQRSAGLCSYAVPEDTADEVFSWQMVQALYLNQEFPVADSLPFVQAVEKLYEVNALAQDNIRRMTDKSPETFASLVQRADEVMEAVSRMVSTVTPLVKWYQTEKIRLGPNSSENLRRQNLEIHEKLQRILSLYMLEDSIKAHEPESKK